MVAQKGRDLQRVQHTQCDRDENRQKYGHKNDGNQQDGEQIHDQRRTGTLCGEDQGEGPLDRGEDQSGAGK